MSTSLSARRAATLPLTILKNIAEEPLLTGALLWALTRGPANLRERLLRPFRNNVLAKDSAKRLAKFIELLKVFVVLGVWKRIDQALTRLALNDWRLKSRGADWRFDVAKGELVVITGGSSGFGYEMVKGFSKKARVVVIDIAELPAKLAALPDVYFYKCDLSDLNAITSCTQAIKNKHGNPTVLVNNAGIANTLGEKITDTKIESLQKIFNINLLSHFVLIRDFLPGMMEARKGHIVTLASTASFLGRAGLLDYSCTKAGAMALHEGLRDQLLTMNAGDCRIRTTSIHPSWHATGMTKPYDTMIRNMGVQPEPASNVANAIIEQVVNDRSGQLIIPQSQERAKRLRTMPIWVRDITNGYLFHVPAKYKV